MRLEQRVLTGGHPLGRDRQQRTHVGVQLVLGTVVGVQGHVDRVLGRDDVGELGQRDRAGDHVFDAEAGSEFSSAGGELDDAVTAGVGETLDARR